MDVRALRVSTVRDTRQRQERDVRLLALLGQVQHLERGARSGERHALLLQEGDRFLHSELRGDDVGGAARQAGDQHERAADVRDREHQCAVVVSRRGRIARARNGRRRSASRRCGGHPWARRSCPRCRRSTGPRRDRWARRPGSAPREPRWTGGRARPSTSSTFGRRQHQVGRELVVVEPAPRRGDHQELDRSIVEDVSDLALAVHREDRHLHRAQTSQRSTGDQRLEPRGELPRDDAPGADPAPRRARRHASPRDRGTGQR